MAWLGKLFTWWNGATFGTAIFSALKGEKVGTDHFGNAYFRAKDGSRRWVIYAGANDASRIDPAWHGWLHGQYDALPDEVLVPVRAWMKPPTGNLTGTPLAYRPQGALERGGRRARATGDYEAWTPDAD